MFQEIPRPTRATRVSRAAWIAFAVLLFGFDIAMWRMQRTYPSQSATAQQSFYPWPIFFAGPHATLLAATYSCLHKYPNAGLLP
jgi:hypothetical protein